MTDRSTFDSFEQRIAEELERYVMPVTDPKPAAEIATVAMRPRGLAVRARNASRRRRFLLLGLAAAFLVPATYFGAASLRPPAPDLVQPSRTDDPRPTVEPSTAGTPEYVSIFVRRDDGPQPGILVIGVRHDGGEVLLRKVLDAIVPGAGKLSEWGTVSRSGWLAVGVDLYGGPWPMILIDLGQENSEPWVISQANLGGIGPSWGPNGLIAAFVDWGTLVIVDPQKHTTRTMSMQGHGLVGGGPSIIWSADGRGIVGSAGTGAYDVVPIDGGPPVPGAGQVLGRYFGPGLAELRVCSPGTNCPGGDDGRIERVETDASVRTIWKPELGDRALEASFGDLGDEYWVSVDQDKGQQIALLHLHDGRQDAIATVHRAAEWQFVGAPMEAPDHSTALVWIDLGGAKPAAVLVPLNGAPASFHAGQFVGFVKSATSTVFTAAPYGPPAATMPAVGEAYRLPSLSELIAAELRLNPGRKVLGQASRDGVAGQTDIRTFDIPRDGPGARDAYLDCLGPTSVTVTSGSGSVTSPCLRAGSYILSIQGPVVVSASGDTSWRVVVYSAP